LYDNIIKYLFVVQKTQAPKVSIQIINIDLSIIVNGAVSDKFGIFQLGSVLKRKTPFFLDSK